MFLTVFVWVFFFVALIAWIFFEYTLDGKGAGYDADKYQREAELAEAVEDRRELRFRCQQILRDGKDDDASEPRIVVLVAKTPAAKLAARIVLGFAAVLAGLWIWGFVDAASVPDTGKPGNILFHAVRIPQLNPVSRSGYLCYLKLSDERWRQKDEDADEERPPKRRRRRGDDDRYDRR